MPADDEHTTVTVHAAVGGDRFFVDLAMRDYFVRSAEAMRNAD